MWVLVIKNLQSFFFSQFTKILVYSVEDFCLDGVLSYEGSMTSSLGRISIVTIDLDAEENKIPKQELEETEEIQCYQVKLSEVKQTNKKIKLIFFFFLL
jgi:hypothetical protein